MSKRLKNTTGSTITHSATGTALASDTYVTISESDAIRMYDEQMFDWFSAGTVIYNDGSADYSDAALAWDSFRGAPQKVLTDSDEASYARLKTAPTGWTFQARGIDFQTSSLSSLVNVKFDGTNWGDATIKFYNSSDVELTSILTIATCVKTVIDWEPAYDYEVIGGTLKALTVPSSDTYVWVVAVPDISEGSGGSKVMINQVNMRYMDTVEADGRTTKRLNYDATYHTNKLRFIIKHGLGAVISCHLVVEHYKA